ncbi:protein lifeguard 1 [Drosophila mauritiana]|uniref:Protein lifeguard 1 n=1 Tax=Drosophila mauritiana TaxID=7226 RepID=A0A6P8KCH5_DROMA|nr:protein lifeguard 1 [Drosophila mauritiana]
MRCCSERREERAPMYFEDRYSRRIFISRVLMIVAINLLMTTLILTFCVFHMGARKFLLKHWYIGLVGIVIILIFSFLMCCCSFLFRSSPCKYILLVIYVLAHACVVCSAGVRYQPKLVFIAVASCAAIVVLLFLFARFAPCDFTGCWIFVFVLSLVVMIMGIVAIFFPTIRIVYASLGVLLFCVYIVIDIQLIIGGRTHKNQFDESDYVLAAMMLYSDIVFLFLFLLDLIGLIDA